MELTGNNRLVTEPVYPVLTGNAVGCRLSQTVCKAAGTVAFFGAAVEVPAHGERT